MGKNLSTYTINNIGNIINEYELGKTNIKICDDYIDKEKIKKKEKIIFINLYDKFCEIKY